MTEINQLIQDADALLALAPEELAGPLLAFLASLTPDHDHRLNRNQFLSQAALNQ